MLRAPRFVLVLAALFGAGTAGASLQDTWPLLAFDSAQGCRLSVAGNGRFIEIRASGLVPGEALGLALANGDMKPAGGQVYADRSGRWSKIYVPFRFGQPGGMVKIGLSASRCTLSASVPWRREVRVID